MFSPGYTYSPTVNRQKTTRGAAVDLEAAGVRDRGRVTGLPAKTDDEVGVGVPGHAVGAGALVRGVLDVGTAGDVVLVVVGARGATDEVSQGLRDRRGVARGESGKEEKRQHFDMVSCWKKVDEREWLLSW